MDCQESEPSDTGISTVEECDPIQKDFIGKEEVFQLFSTFYEASMIPRKVGEKPIQFEVTIGYVLWFYVFFSLCSDGRQHSLRNSTTEQDNFL